MKLYIKYMMSARCKMAVKAELTKIGLHFIVVDLGEVDIMETISADEREQLKRGLLAIGLELMDDKKALLIERVKQVITELILRSSEEPKVAYSDYIGMQLKIDYTFLSNLFSEVRGMTIQQYIIIRKIERVKELLVYDQLNLTEIAYQLRYSSVAHLSNQFKKITGLSPSHFKLLKEKRRDPSEVTGIAVAV